MPDLGRLWVGESWGGVEMCPRRRELQGGKNFTQKEQQVHPHHAGQMPQLYANDFTAPSQQPWGSGWTAAPERCNGV